MSIKISGDVHGSVSDVGNYNSGVIANIVNIGNLVQLNKSTLESLSARDALTLDIATVHRDQLASYNAHLGGTVTREACTPGTRVDILKRIYAWAEDPSSNSPSIFWLTGEAGSGKSTIAYSVARHFDGEDDEGALQDPPKILGANFFCSRQFEETRQKQNIIPSIVDQLARQSQPYANALLKASTFTSVNVTTKQMKDLLVDPWTQSVNEHHAKFPPFLVVVDALDEIEESGGSAFLEELLRMTYKSHLKGIKFLITSRPDVDLAKLCSSFTSDAICALYDVPTDTVKGDIATYLHVKLPKLRGMPVVNELMRQADGLFIFAATAVRYITPRPKMMKREQIQLLGELGIHADRSTVSRNPNASPIDALYKQVMSTAFGGLKDNMLQDRLYALHTVLCTEERVSSSVAGELESEDPEMAELVELVVDELHAVLYVKDDRVLWYHASFPDFIFSQARSGNVLLGIDSHAVDVHCEEDAHHARLARSCFRFMKSQLRFNICSSFLLDSEVPDLNDRIRAKIGGSVRYSCLHWAQHLARTSSYDGRTEIRDFLQLKVLFWIEVMNLLDSRAQCTPILQQAREYISRGYGGRDLDLTREVLEAANFATYFVGSVASQSTPHLYISSLATWSRDSILSRMKQFPHVPAFEQTGGDGSLPLLTIWGESVVNSVAFSSDGICIVSGSRDKSVRVWDASTGAELRRLDGHSDWVRSVACSSDGTRIVSGSDDESVRIWDASTGVELRRLEGHSDEVYTVAYSSDDTRIVSGSYDTSVRVWDASTGAELKRLEGHSDQVSTVAFSSDGTRIVSGSDDRSVRVWDASTGSELRRLKGHSSVVYSVSFSCDGTRIVSGSDDKYMRVWDASTGAELRRLDGHSDHVYSAAFSSDDTRIVSGSDDKSVRVWDASTGAETRGLEGHSECVRSVAFSSDGTRIVSGSHDGSVRIWDASTGAELRRLEGHSLIVHSVAFSSDGTRIVSGSYDKSVLLWDASTGAELRRLKGHSNQVYSVAFSSDGTRIVSGSDDRSVRVWDASTGSELRRLKGHSSFVYSVALSGDGTRIVSGSRDKSVRVWDASTGSELRRLEGHSHSVYSVAFSSDATRIVSGSHDKSVRIWDASTGTELRRLEGHSECVRSVSFSNDGTRIVSGSDDNSVRVWHVVGHNTPWELPSHGSWIMSLPHHQHKKF